MLITLSIKKSVSETEAAVQANHFGVAQEVEDTFVKIMKETASG